MDNLEKILKDLLKSVDLTSKEIPVGISNRHIHLEEKHIDILFGDHYKLTKLKDLSQPGQYACKEVVTICGPKGAIEKVRVLGPKRKETQVEVSVGDTRALGIKSVVRLSGKLEGSESLTIVGPKGSVYLKSGVIVAQRHIHMNKSDAINLDVENKEFVSIEIDGLRGGILNNVNIRIDDEFSLECHLDVEEANAMGINGNSKIQIKK